MSQYTFPSDNVIGFQTNMSTYNEESDFVKLHDILEIKCLGNPGFLYI